MSNSREDALKYRKKPVVIEAMQWLPFTNEDKVIAWMIANDASFDYDKPTQTIKIRTMESHDAPLTVCIADWIIKGIQGEFYPCAPDIFEATYEPA